MGLEHHGNNNNAYYYTKQRVGRRVISTYAGKGEYALLLWEAETVKQARSDERRAAWANERAQIEAADELVDDLATMVHALMVETLHQAGYHRHKRQWRKRR